MKKIGLFITAALFLISCSEKTVSLEITNSSETDRINELVNIPWTNIKEKLVLPEGKSIIVLDESGEQIPYQLITNGETEPQEILFPATVNKGNKAIYSIKTGTPREFDRMTYGRAVPERKDDFAWENDRIAFRMYGPALADENPSNGVDIWLKRTNNLIIDKFYSDELERGISYHVDNGDGLDCYKVGHTLGAGGIAPFVNDSLWINGHYTTAKILDSGLLRTTFVLTFDSVQVDDKYLAQTLTISLDAGSQLNKAVVTYNGEFESLKLAPGIWLHNKIDNIKTDKNAGYIAYAENAVSDAGLESGRNFVGVLIPDNNLEDAVQHNDHLLAFTNYNKGDKFVYYFGAGWNKWGFDSDDQWFDYMNQFSQKLKQQALTVTIK